jgi:hypothetical protein
MIMDYFKNLLIGLITGIAAYLNPISGEIKSLIAVFALNFICGLLTALLINHESFFHKNRHKAQRKAKFYINKCRSASCMQSGWKRTSA